MNKSKLKPASLPTVRGYDDLWAVSQKFTLPNGVTIRVYATGDTRQQAWANFHKDKAYYERRPADPLQWAGGAAWDAAGWLDGVIKALQRLRFKAPKRAI